MTTPVAVPVGVSEEPVTPSKVPKGGGAKLPKPVQMARDALLAKGITDVTADSLKAALSAKQYNALCNSFRTTMTPNTKKMYSGLRTDMERRAWVAQYVVDPETACCQGYNRVEAINEKTQQGTEQWLHESEIAGPRGYRCAGI